MFLKRIYALGVAASVLSGAIAKPHRKLQDAYEVEVTEIALFDVDTQIPDIVAVHNGALFNVSASLEWAENIIVEGSSNTLTYETTIDGEVIDTGSIDLNASRDLPTTIECGQGTMDASGKHTVSVKVTIDDSSSENSRDYQSFAAGVSFIPLILVLVIAGTTHMVELALGLGIFCGACMVAGSLTAGFRDMLDNYILKALADEDHGYVYLFILFMAGLVGLMEKSGGLHGVTEALKGFVKTIRSSQAAVFAAGCLIFFDDYANCLVAGYSMRSLTDACGLSREKLAFIVDATAAPIASIIPISSWVGFEISLIQAELDFIHNTYNDPDISDSGFSVFLETIKYRYYCIFMLMFIPLLIISGRDFGPMLIAERKAQVYGRTDGGDGAMLAADGNVLKSHNAPPEDLPKRWWNLALPIVMLVIYIFYLLAWTGQDPSNPDQTFVNVMENSNSYQALLWGTMAAALTSVAFYFLQDYQDGRILWFNVKGWFSRTKKAVSGCCRKQDENEQENKEEEAKILMDYEEAMSSFILGMEKIFGALVVLTLAWASGAIMQAVGLNRLFGAIITNPALNYTSLPTLSFVISILIAFATGTSWGTMTIMFPLIVAPSYTASGGDPNIVYGVIAGILAGAVAGDHASPISDTTILGAMASECILINHVKTQAPYAGTVAIWAILVGTLPSGRGAFGNGICTLLGFVFMAFHAFLTAAPAINKTGRYDIFTEIYLFFSKDKELLDLKEKAKEVFESGQPLLLQQAGDDIAKPLKGGDEDLKDEGEEVVIDEDTSNDNAAGGEEESEPQAADAERPFAGSAISA
jgi:Na+/H+ antiporter NhaC